MAEVRRNAGVRSVRRVLAGQDAPRLYRSADGCNQAFAGAVAEAAVIAEAWDCGDFAPKLGDPHGCG